ncbi:MAG: prepilin-type N-terminal cleavage/methylation domain-containing protein [Dehalogenimonas sp.]|uniref:Prepilin-type N-terminal cleavage/methylation domain-containing protein n=1 Tax=Candidatus Dehalogenimonas loeffleri TaxID=3127115 RepID=A0ABZ2JAQ9_9CHLR|nr:prepilin-type N-terminal cleavage/methylation domain-containing protein [Dehalogenimonas sp.]
MNKIKLKKNGFSMVEVLIALLLLGTVGLGFLAVLANSSSHTLNADVRATAESIARSQMEYVKAQPYDGSNPPVYLVDTTKFDATIWQITITGERLDPRGDGTGNDDGLQKITITVEYYRGGSWDDVVVLEGYKYTG